MNVTTPSPDARPGAAARAWLERALFAPPGRASAPVAALVLLGLFLLGAAHWTVFLERGRLEMRAHDWDEEYLYLAALREAVRQRVVPWHTSQASHGSDRLLGNPQVPWSPQVLLLERLEVGPFVLAHTLLLYAAGFAGCLVLRRRLGLSLVAFTFLSLLFHLNGHLVAHLAVGHLPWLSYLLLPWLLVVVLDVVEGRGTRRSPVLAALVVLAMFLQGGFHFFTWSLLLVALLGLFRPEQRRFALATGAWAVALCFCRLLPGLVAYGGKDHPFLGGFPTLTDLVAGLVVIRPPERALHQGVFGAIGWWEIDFYVGLVGAAYLGWFGLACPLRDPDGPLGRAWTALRWPAAVLAACSLGALYWPVTALHVPLLGAERVATRFLLLPLLLLLVVAAARLQATLDREADGARRLSWALALGLVEVASALAAHSRTWLPRRIEPTPAERALDLSVSLVVGREDPTYRLAVQASLAVSALALAAALVWLLRPARPAAGPGASPATGAG